MSRPSTSAARGADGGADGASCSGGVLHGRDGYSAELPAPKRVGVRREDRDLHGDRRYTYREFEEPVHRLASRLRDAGLRKGDRVAFLVPTIPPLLEAHFAVPAASCVLVPINTRLTADEVVHIVRHSGARMLFADAELEHLVQSVDRARGGGGTDRRHWPPRDPYEDSLAAGSPEADAR